MPQDIPTEDMDRLNIYEKFNTYIYEIFLVMIIVFHYGGILYTNSFLSGANIFDFVDLKSDTIQTAAFKSANLPVFYLFEFLYKDLGLSNEFIKAVVTLFSLVVIVFSIYKITLCVFNSKLGGVLAVILFLYSSLYFAVLFSNLNFIDDANPDALSYSFLMLGIFYWLKERPNLASIFMGLSFGCHPILPIGFIVTFFMYQLISYKRIGVRSIITTLLLFLIVTLPVTFGVVKSVVFVTGGAGAQGLDAELIWKYVRFAHPQSAFIDVMPQFHYGLSLYFSSFLLLLVLYNYGDKAQKEKYFKLFLLVFAVFAFTIFEILNSYHFKIISLYNLWLHRFMTYGSVITYIVLAGGAFCTIHENRINNFLRVGLFLLLGLSVFARELEADLYMTFWANHFYILEIVMIYYLYNLYYSYSKNELPFKVLTVNLIFLAVALICFYHIAVYDRFKPQPPFLGLFQWDNIRLFLKVVFYRQFEYAWTYNFYQGFYVLLACSACFGTAYLFNLYIDAKRQEELRYKTACWLAIASILSITLMTLLTGTRHVLLACSVCLGTTYLFDLYMDVKKQEELRYKTAFGLAIAGILSITLITLLTGTRVVSVVSKEDNPLHREKLYAIWTMDDTAGDGIKDAKGRYDALAVSTGTVKGFLGNARYFNGKDSYIKTPVNFQGWKGFTISLWVYPEQKNEGGLAVILDNGHDADRNFVIQSADINDPNSGRWVFHCNGIDIPLMIPPSQWTHLVIVADAKKGDIQAYTNGVRAGKATVKRGFEFGDVPLSIGKLAMADDRYFKGSIDEVAILDEAIDEWREGK